MEEGETGAKIHTREEKAALARVKLFEEQKRAKQAKLERQQNDWRHKKVCLMHTAPRYASETDLRHAGRRRRRIGYAKCKTTCPPCRSFVPVRRSSKTRSSISSRSLQPASSMEPARSSPHRRSDRLMHLGVKRFPRGW
eukprot:619146-Rhodomonas_salina.1